MKRLFSILGAVVFVIFIVIAVQYQMYIHRLNKDYCHSYYCSNPKDADKEYCTACTCHYDECENQIRSKFGDQYCLIHTCKYRTSYVICRDVLLPNSNYCLAHTCSESECYDEVWKNSKCITHYKYITPQPTATPRPTPTPTTRPTLWVDIDVEVEYKNNEIILYIETNLPTGTTFDVALSSPDDYGAYYPPIRSATVVNGKIEVEPYTSAPPGKYFLTLFMDEPSKQSWAVRDVIGSKGEFMRGVLIEPEPVYQEESIARYDLIFNVK